MNAWDEAATIIDQVFSTFDNAANLTSSERRAKLETVYDRLAAQFNILTIERTFSEQNNSNANIWSENCDMATNCI